MISHLPPRMKQYRMDCTHQRQVVIFLLRLRQIDNIDRLLPLNMTLRPWIPYEWKYDYKLSVSSLFWAIKFDIIIDNNDNTKKLVKRKSSILNSTNTPKNFEVRCIAEYNTEKKFILLDHSLSKASIITIMFCNIQCNQIAPSSLHLISQHYNPRILSQILNILAKTFVSPVSPKLRLKCVSTYSGFVEKCFIAWDFFFLFVYQNWLGKQSILAVKVFRFQLLSCLR